MLTARTVSGAASLAQDLLAERLNALGQDPEEATETGEHPEGRKRGGLVSVFVEGGARAYYDETSCEWFPYDSGD